MYVLGTAGHVDHGKSAFLRQLTQMEPDRLPEEKARGMTIDLNFVWFRTSRGDKIGIVDVPGHERFVRNMISGTMNIDAFLFLVASDDGWMPQSDEHLKILRALGVTRGVGILSKIDLVTPSRVRETEAVFARNWREVLGTEPCILPFSAITSESLPKIQGAIETMLQSLPAPRELGCSRLWIDRVFTPRGEGVVVTGTLREGSIRVGDELYLWPCEKTVVVKALQSYHQAIQTAAPVTRVALQLGRIQTSGIARGNLLLKVRAHLTQRAIVSLQIHGEMPKRNVRLSFHLGTTTTRVLLIRFGKDPRFASLKFDAPFPVRAGDRFVLRTPGEERMWGGGVVVDPMVAKVSQSKALKALDGYEGTPEGVMTYSLRRHGAVDIELMLKTSCYTRGEFEGVVQKRKLSAIAPNLFVDPTDLAAWTKQVKDLVADHFTTTNMPIRELELSKELSDRITLSDRYVTLCVAHWIREGVIDRGSEGVVPKGGALKRPPDEEAKEKMILGMVRSHPEVPVHFRELLRDNKLKHSVWRLVKDGTLTHLGEDHFVESKSYQATRAHVEAYLRQKGQATTSELRVFLKTSRKHAVLFLEHLDQDRITYLKDGIRRLLR